MHARFQEGRCPLITYFFRNSDDWIGTLIYATVSVASFLIFTYYLRKRTHNFNTFNVAYVLFALFYPVGYILLFGTYGYFIAINNIDDVTLYEAPIMRVMSTWDFMTFSVSVILGVSYVVAYAFSKFERSTYAVALSLIPPVILPSVVSFVQNLEYGTHSFPEKSVFWEIVSNLPNFAFLILVSTVSTHLVHQAMRAYLAEKRNSGDNWKQAFRNILAYPVRRSSSAQRVLVKGERWQAVYDFPATEIYTGGVSSGMEAYKGEENTMTENTEEKAGGL